RAGLLDAVRHLTPADPCVELLPASERVADGPHGIPGQLGVAGAHVAPDHQVPAPPDLTARAEPDESVGEAPLGFRARLPSVADLDLDILLLVDHPDSEQKVDETP